MCCTIPIIVLIIKFSFIYIRMFIQYYSILYKGLYCVYKCMAYDSVCEVCIALAVQCVCMLSWCVHTYVREVCVSARCAGGSSGRGGELIEGKTGWIAESVPVT